MLIKLLQSKNNTSYFAKLVQRVLFTLFVWKKFTAKSECMFQFAIEQNIE